MKGKNKITMQKLSKSDSETLISDVSKLFDLTTCQLYNPIFANYMTYYNNNYSINAFQLNSKYTMIACHRDANSNVIGKIVKSYSANNNNNNTWNAKVFVKINPLLDVCLYIKNFYSFNYKNPSMPNKYIHSAINKLNSPNNSGYIEAFSLFVLSRLTETGKCPLFPYYYGTYNGIAKSFKCDITDDYRQLHHNKYFIENKDKIFTVIEEKCNDFDIMEPNENSQSETNKDTDLNTDLNIESENESVWESDEENDNENVGVIDEQKNIIMKSIRNAKRVMKDVMNELDTNSQHGGVDNVDFDIDDIDWSEHEGTGLIEHFNDGYNMNSKYYAEVKDFPVQLISMEKLELTLDQYIMTNDGKIEEDEWLSILFQICFGLAVCQKDLWFTHNDLHGNNIMFKKTKENYLYFHYEDQYFRLPTYGKITKIIDFARSIVKVEDKLYFSDVFRKDGHAEGQYSYPYRHYNFDTAKHKPNMSFDLARLATTIAHNVSTSSRVYQLLLSWMTDKYGNDLGKDEDNFELYVKIARNIDNAIPEKQMKKNIFNSFHVDKSEIPSNTFVYYF